MGTINALPYTAVFLTSAPNPDYVFDTVLTGDSDAVFQSATAQDTFVYFSLNNSAKGLAINPFTLEPIPIVISITTSTAADLLTIVDPKIHGFPAPAVLELDLVNATFAAAGDAAVFFVNYTLIDEVTNATASNLITVHYVPTLPTATEAIESANSALSFPSTLDAVEALYVGYFGAPGDLAGIGSSLGQIFSDRVIALDSVLGDATWGFVALSVALLMARALYGYMRHGTQKIVEQDLGQE